MSKNFIPTINISSLIKNNFETQNAFKTIKTPIKPKIIADHLLIPIVSFKNNFANIDTKKGEEKNRAFAVAKGIKVNEIKKAEKAIKCKITLNIVKKG